MHLVLFQLPAEPPSSLGIGFQVWSISAAQVLPLHSESLGYCVLSVQELCSRKEMDALGDQAMNLMTEYCWHCMPTLSILALLVQNAGQTETTYSFLDSTWEANSGMG